MSTRRVLLVLAVLGLPGCTSWQPVGLGIPALMGLIWAAVMVLPGPYT